jgi:acyl carrier protein
MSVAIDSATHLLEDVRRELVEIWQKVLAISEVQPGEDFFTLGGDSLSAVELMLEIDRRFGINLDPVEVLETPSLDDFARVVHSLLESKERYS